MNLEENIQDILRNEGYESILEERVIDFLVFFRLDFMKFSVKHNNSPNCLIPVLHH